MLHRWFKMAACIDRAVMLIFGIIAYQNLRKVGGKSV
jgi:hypothetical protein